MIRTIIARPPSGVAHSIAAPEEEPYAAVFRSLGAVNVPVSIPHRKFRISPLMELAAFVRKAEVAVIHSHGFGAGIYSRLLSVLTGIPCIHTFHGLSAFSASALRGAVKWTIEWCLAGLTGVLVTVSISEQGLAQRQLKRYRDKLRLIENGVEFPQGGTSPARNRGGRLVIVWVGRLCEVKNPLAVLDIAEACNEHGKSGPTPRFLVVGEGPLFHQMSRMIERKGLQEVVELLGRSDNICQILSQCHVFLSTSFSEGLPVAMLEAMSCGLPVVASRVQGNLDLVCENLNGYLFSCSDPCAASEPLMRLAHDEELRLTLGAESRRRVIARYSADRMRSEYAKLYSEVASARHKEFR